MGTKSKAKGKAEDTAPGKKEGPDHAPLSPKVAPSAAPSPPLNPAPKTSSSRIAVARPVPPDAEAPTPPKADKAEADEKTEPTDPGPKGEKAARADKADKADAGDKPEKAEKPEKADKPAKAEKADKPAKAEKAEKADKPAKAEKTAKGEKTAKADGKPAKGGKKKGDKKGGKKGKGKAAEEGEGEGDDDERDEEGRPKRALGLRGAAPWAARHAAKHAAEARKRAAEPPPPGSARATIRTPSGVEEIKARVAEIYNQTERIKTLRKNLNKSFFDVGLILREIQNQKLYTAKGYQSFESFVERELDLGKTVTMRLVKLVSIFQREAALEMGYERTLEALNQLEGNPDGQNSGSDPKMQVAKPSMPTSATRGPIVGR
jgi:hypothetical protein